jgi:DNA-binding transcriptional LysR family regulator
MELRQLTYFECLYRERNVTRAAQRLNIVQSALSMQISKLEHELGCALFERTPRGVTPTPAGARAYELFAPLLERLRQARVEISAGGGATVTGSIRIGLVASATNEALADTIAYFARHHPGVEIHATYGFSGELVAQLRAGELDCAVVNQFFGQDDLVCQEILDEELVLVAGAQTALTCPVPVPFYVLASMDVVLPSPRHGLRMVIDDALRTHAVSVRPQIEVDDLSVIAALLSRSERVAVLPASVAGNGLQEGTLRAYAFQRPGLSRRMLCVSLPGTPRPTAVSLFVDVLAERLETLVSTSVTMTATSQEDSDERP